MKRANREWETDLRLIGSLLQWYFFSSYLQGDTLHTGPIEVMRCNAIGRKHRNIQKVIRIISVYFNKKIFHWNDLINSLFMNLLFSEAKKNFPSKAIHLIWNISKHFFQAVVFDEFLCSRTEAEIRNWIFFIYNWKL